MKSILVILVLAISTGVQFNRQLVFQRMYICLRWFSSLTPSKPKNKEEEKRKPETHISLIEESSDSKNGHQYLAYERKLLHV